MSIAQTGADSEAPLHLLRLPDGSKGLVRTYGITSAAATLGCEGIFRGSPLIFFL